MKALFWAWVLAILASSAQACLLKASWEPWAPYQFQDEAGKLTGLDNELIELVANAVDCRIALIEVPWKRALSMLKAGKLHVTAGASKTKERQQLFLFSKPYRTESVSLFIHKNNVTTYNFQQLENLANSDFKFGTVRGYFYGNSFSELKMSGQLNGQITETLSDEQNFKLLTTGRLTGVLADPFAGSAIIKQHKYDQEIMRMATPVHESGIHFIFTRKGNMAPLRKRFDYAIDELKKNGKLEEIYKKYLY